MARFRYNKVLLAFMFIGLLAALVVCYQRHVVEEQATRVELAIDYEDVVALARTEGVKVGDLFNQFKEAGITSLAVYDMTPEKLHNDGRLTVLPGTALLGNNRLGLPSIVSQTDFNPERVYIFGKEKNVPDLTYDEARSDLIRRLGADRVHDIVDQPVRALSVSANYEKMVKWNLGLSSEEIRDAEARGFWVIVRPTNYTKVTEDDVRAVFARTDGVKRLSGMMFVGEEVLGYPNLLPLTAQLLKERNMTLGMIEHPLQLQFLKQEGITALATLMNYQAARVYVIPKEEQLKLLRAEAVQRWWVGDQERNIRINLLRKYDKPDTGRTILETNLRYVTETKDGLLAKGFTLGRAGWFEPYFPSKFLLALIVLGAVAAGVLLLSLIYPFASKWQYILLLVLGTALVVPVLIGGGKVARQAAALAGACIIPVLAMTWQLDRWRALDLPETVSLVRVLWEGAKSITATFLLALCGGFYVASLLGDVRFFLEMEIYRGVKLTFIMPLVLVTLTYFARYPLLGEPVDSVRGFYERTVRFLDVTVKVKTLLIAAVAAVGIYVFIGRSGHTAGVPVAEAELKLRAFLEQAMYARPRGKEAFIGHPAFMLAVLAVFKRWPVAVHFALVILATIAMGSLVETFAHLRTPVFMSTVRAFNGLVVGAVLGAVAVCGVWLLQSVLRSLERRLSGE